MECLTNPTSQPSLDFSPIWIQFISDEVTKYNSALWHRVAYTFKSCGLGFHPADGANDRNSFGFIILLLFLYMDVRDLVFFVRFVQEIITLYYSFVLSILHHKMFTAYFLVTSLGLILYVTAVMWYRAWSDFYFGLDHPVPQGCISETWPSRLGES
jgi:hypothetical protein